MFDSRLTTVYLGNYATNVNAASTHDAARQAIAFFSSPFWKGPRPKPDSVLEIVPMGSDKKYRVKAGSVARTFEKSRLES